MPRTKKAKPAQTTAQQLSALIKSVRQILRKDKGLNGDADRLPLLTWVMFLKFLDDLETRKADEAAKSHEDAPDSFHQSCPVDPVAIIVPGARPIIPGRGRRSGSGPGPPPAW